MADDSKGVTQTYSIKSMQGFMIFPNQITTYVADHDLPWEYVWIEFDGLRVKSILDNEMIVGMASPSKSPVLEQGCHAQTAFHSPEMRIGKDDIDCF